ncbi:hypothetical protein [Streptomyces sp. NPDC058614]|uniref:hypothetical protein n=1 Tax=Streptomyces sp. NPDC058614 TaxID=3346557 RepID=UPI003666EBE7
MTITDHGLTVIPYARRTHVPRVRRTPTPLSAIDPNRRTSAHALARIAPAAKSDTRFNAGL